jgi:hypothetical protein
MLYSMLNVLILDNYYKKLIYVCVQNIYKYEKNYTIVCFADLLDRIFPNQ